MQITYTVEQYSFLNKPFVRRLGSFASFAEGEAELEREFDSIREDGDEPQCCLVYREVRLEEDDFAILDRPDATERQRWANEFRALLDRLSWGSDVVVGTPSAVFRDRAAAEQWLTGRLDASEANAG